MLYSSSNPTQGLPNLSLHQSPVIFISDGYLSDSALWVSFAATFFVDSWPAMGTVSVLEVTQRRLWEYGYYIHFT